MRLDALNEFAFEDSTQQPRVYGHDGAVVIELHGEIDLLAYQKMAPLLDPITGGTATTVVIDLTRTTFFDCSGVALLVRAHRRTTARGARLAVVCTHHLTLRVLRLTGLTPVLSPVPSLEEALERALEKD
ncbi:anti-sigma factor antagonist [Streptomyces durmitorensis]|uniref:Anti-sigma factor antagonist n=1 Tax=Streptomyces durmitorensis TaxID=319947 RepID=A0ABY4Q3D3_9ACTN|nr:STAS domain-containing protein [Streptomyces durmitorensis]UQT60185.1 STAS domain-containing protein [Streptomyces durmitorensis]